jgi:predicted phosphodiesterase
MKIALFSDVHANLPALEAFFTDVEPRQPDAIYCLGDLVGHNIWPNEVIAEIRKRGVPTISGNYDFGVARGLGDCGAAYLTDEEGQTDQLSIAHTNRIIGNDERDYLRSLPASIRMEYQLDNDILNLLLVHASPRKLNEDLHKDLADHSMIRMMKAARAEILCFGHTHKPYHRIIQHEGRYLHTISTGSIGKPRDGDPRGCYVMLTINQYSSTALKNSIHAEFIRFDYNVKKAAMAIEYSSLPDEYAELLRTGR